MAHFRSVMWFIAGCLLAAVPMFAYALPTPTFYIQDVGGVSCTSADERCSVSAAMEACAVAQVQYHTGGTGYYIWDGGMGGLGQSGADWIQGIVIRAAGATEGGAGTYCTAKARAGTCPEATTWNTVTNECEGPEEPDCSGEGQYYSGLTGACECKAGFDDGPGGTCASNCDARGAGWGRYATSNASSACRAGCLVNRQGDGTQSSSCSPTAFDASGQPTAWVCDMGYTGGNCSYAEALPGEAPPTVEPEAAPEPCKDGSSGTVNGVPVCLPLPPPTDVKTPKTTTTVNPDGTITTTTEQTTTTVTPGGTVVTTTVTNSTNSATPEVTTTTEETSTEGAAGFCEHNPDSPVCGSGGEDASVWGGDCEAEPVCEGDAIQCAIARGQWEVTCAMRVSEETQAAGEAALSQEIGEGDPRQKLETAVELTNAQGSLSAGAGLQDQSVVVMGKTVVLTFSKINPYLDMFGAAMLAIAWIIAAGVIRSAL